MLGIPKKIAHLLVSQTEPKPKSFLAPLLAQTAADWDQTEASLDEWMEKTAQEIAPEAGRAGRMLREVAGLFLERKALAALREKFPYQMRMIPVPADVEEAVQLAAAEVMYASPEERKATKRILEMMDQGLLKPQM